MDYGGAWQTAYYNPNVTADVTTLNSIQINLILDGMKRISQFLFKPKVCDSENHFNKEKVGLSQILTPFWCMLTAYAIGFIVFLLENTLKLMTLYSNYFHL